MRVLAFDTATAATAVALRDVGPGSSAVDLEARDDPDPGARPGHARVLLGLIDALLADGGGWESVDRLAVGIGPGTFTGLRIGIATAHALARARGVELVGVSTLASLAAGARAAALLEDAPGEAAAVLAVIDARRGEVFAAAWPAGADPAAVPPALAPCVLAPDALGRALEEAAIPAGSAAAFGDGAVRFRQALERTGASVARDDSPLHRVSAREHCRLAARLEPGAAVSILPAYLRLPDAELTRPA